MNRGVIVKAARETWAATLLLGLGLLFVEAILSYVLPTFQEQFSATFLQLRFVQSFLQALLGTEISGRIDPGMFVSVAWVHPVVLAIVWTHAILLCTRVPAGEVDRGTVDILLGLPVSRWELCCSETFLWIVSGVAILSMGMAGNVLGSSRLPPEMRPDASRQMIVLANLLCLYLAIGALTWLLSSMSNRRGRAISAAFGAVLASFLLTYLAQIWSPAERVSFLSVLHYYRPLPVLRDGLWPGRDMLVLGAVSAGLWVAAGVIFNRRDLSTV